MAHRCPNGHDPQYARNSIPGHIVLVCRPCGLIRLETLGEWIPGGSGGMAKLCELIDSTRRKTRDDRRDERLGQLQEAINGMEYE
jgi:hypothetical protein